MSKIIFFKMAIVTCIASVTIVSCSKTNDVQPPSSISVSNDLSQSLATTASTKITVAGSTLQLGINGHPLGDAPYVATSATKQIALIKSMGMSWYRFDVQSTSDGSITVPYLSNPLITAADAGNVKLLPMLYPRTLDYSASQSESYKAGKLLGSNFAAKNGSHFDYYELGNDLELKLLLPNQTGVSQADYDRNKFNVLAAYLKGMDEGIKLKDPGAKTMISAGWLHYGFLRMLDWYGVKFDIVAYNWYSEMEAIAPNSPTNIPDITVKLSSLFPGKPIWITETNTRYKAVNSAEQDQNAFLTKFIAKCKNNPQVKVLLIYELFNEPAKNTLEGNYGIVKWTNPFTTWAKKTVANNLTIN
ncbi:glycosyl hydrolase [Mucilaginibacter sp.]|uniref:glycosyl hydrolase n=1 Tax=Mucilaginibacter sp. TaxID=1882438 RepID=UPI00263734CF|nr:glycosyl hydrolase [Mucilaginibacter sp.]MDB4919461.1 hypothetical protein [Mucilaginibacter sp.]